MSVDDLESCEKVRSCFTGTNVQILAFWYKSTNTDAAGQVGLGTQFTCYTGTKVQMLTGELLYWYKSTNAD
jgi:hypothetical protein